ncbi:MAG: phosphoribosylaminoimidazolesuccinocarboxamide synthase [Spirochaetes bacterium]|nr:phosphoribosylaminoimidazolesuccinocarboxamide synthase [Spirochaetota bacterium]
MGSVKDLQIIEEASGKSLGRGRFVFSDRYSVFDWGEMPDQIDDKGKSLALLSGYFLEKLKRKGIKTHYLGIMNEKDEVKTLDSIDIPSNSIEVSLVRVVKPALKNNIYNYTVYKTEQNNFLIPFEIIYRNRLPENSSVFKRLEKGEVTPEYFGLKEYPKAGQVLDIPLFDISTKLEVNDRYITWDEAKEMAALSDEEIRKIRGITSKVNDIITEDARRIGMINEDGKIELAFNENREIIVVDTLGTLDECRFNYKDHPVSKEIARKYYRQTEWFQKVEKAKQADRFKWKEIVGEEPEKLPKEFKDLFAAMYKTTANQITGKEFFKGVPDMDTIIQGMEKYIK